MYLYMSVQSVNIIYIVLTSSDLTPSVALFFWKKLVFIDVFQVDDKSQFDSTSIYISQHIENNLTCRESPAFKIFTTSSRKGPSWVSTGSRTNSFELGYSFSATFVREVAMPLCLLFFSRFVFVLVCSVCLCCTLCKCMHTYNAHIHVARTKKHTSCVFCTSCWPCATEKWTIVE